MPVTQTTRPRLTKADETSTSKTPHTSEMSGRRSGGKELRKLDHEMKITNGKAKEVEKPKKVDKRSFKFEEWTRPLKEKPIDDIDLVPLTQHHKEIIQTTWREQIQHQMTVYGVKIFQQIFKLNPKMVEVFAFGQQLVDSDEYTTDKNVTRHPRQFMEAVEAAVNNIDNMETIVAAIFVNLGKHHIYFRGLDERYFDTFSGSMMCVWREMFEEEFAKPEVRTAWSRLFDFILQHLKFGYSLAVREKAEMLKEK